MKPLRSNPRILAIEFAKKLVDNAEMHSALNRHGQVSHIVARMRREDFEKIYPAWAQASIFINGQWLLFEFAGDCGSVINRSTRSRLEFSIIEETHLGRTLVRFHRLGKTIMHCSMKSYFSESPWQTSGGLQTLAKASCKAFGGKRRRCITDDAVAESLPTIHVLPSPRNDEEFDSSLVLLQ